MTGEIAPLMEARGVSRRAFLESVGAGCVLLTTRPATAVAQTGTVPPPYTPMGVGGGGALSGLSFSPYADLWFVGTDMGTLFRSVDAGQSWQPVAHDQATFSEDLSAAAPLGFLPDGKTVLHAAGGVAPRRSGNGGVDWTPMPVFPTEALIRYWIEDPSRPGTVFAATDGGLVVSRDWGLTWAIVPGTAGYPVGTFIDTAGSVPVIHHATTTTLFRSADGGATFEPRLAASIRSFAGGRDASALTLAYIGSDQPACTAGCRQVLISTDDGPFVPAQWRDENGGLVDQEGGDHLRMARNDSRTIYVTGSSGWANQTGTKVWVSRDGRSFGPHVFLQLDWSKNPYAPWPADKLEWSAVGLDIGWNDGGYHSFAVHPLKSHLAGGTGQYFLHVTHDSGRTWRAPFTRHVPDDSGATAGRKPGDRWASTGLEVTSIRYLKFHPRVPSLGYACGCDHHSLVTEDGGASWRVVTRKYNSIYDIAFDPEAPDIAYVAAGSVHDWGHHGNLSPLLCRCPNDARGGVFRLSDRGRRWDPVGTSEDDAMNTQCLSIAYDHARGILYAGTQGDGIFRLDADNIWRPLVKGLGKGPHVVPQIEVDPADGTVYALLTGNADRWDNITRTGLYRLDPGGAVWQSMRGTLVPPRDVTVRERLLSYPMGFAIDLRPGGDRSTLYLVDADRNEQWYDTGLWRSRDRGATWRMVAQHTHARQVVIDPVDPSRVYVAGELSLDERWGDGGLMVYDGSTVHHVTNVPLRANGWSVTPDPNDPAALFHTFFGGGMMRGPRP